mmetsp:Transcript_30513/g.56834  ORF Transcript_30513/g.56834 Transcript_30513/m.56834 type:complete len:156 (-) Transcript_30513:2283-2750(-)
MTTSYPLRVTRKWLERAVVGGDIFRRPLCPFANKPWRDGKVKVHVFEGSCQEQLLLTVCRELNELFSADDAEVRTQSRPETTLVVSPQLFREDYRSMIHFSWRIMEFISSNDHLIDKVQVRSAMFNVVFSRAPASQLTLKPIPFLRRVVSCHCRW